MDIVESTPGRIPAIQFSDSADLDSLGSILYALQGWAFQFTFGDPDDPDLMNAVIKDCYAGTVWVLPMDKDGMFEPLGSPDRINLAEIVSVVYL